MCRITVPFLFYYINSKEAKTTNRGGGYDMVICLLRMVGPSHALLDWLRGTVEQSVERDDRITAVMWCAQVLCGLRTFADTMEPTDELIYTGGAVAKQFAAFLETFTTDIDMEVSI